jgi:hypothetical protein
MKPISAYTTDELLQMVDEINSHDLKPDALVRTVAKDHGVSIYGVLPSMLLNFVADRLRAIVHPPHRIDYHEFPKKLAELGAFVVQRAGNSNGDYFRLNRLNYHLVENEGYPNHTDWPLTLIWDDGGETKEFRDYQDVYDYLDAVKDEKIETLGDLEVFLRALPRTTLVKMLGEQPTLQVSTRVGLSRIAKYRIHWSGSAYSVYKNTDGSTTATPVAAPSGNLRWDNCEQIYNYFYELSALESA